MAAHPGRTMHTSPADSPEMIPEVPETSPPIMDQPQESSYLRTLRATSVIAGAKVATIIVGVIRMKVVAMLLGTTGVGLINFISSSSDLVRILTNFGLDSATVRNVAEATARQDEEEVAASYRVAVRSAIVIGIFSWIVFAACSPWLAQSATGKSSDAWLFLIGGATLVLTPLLAVQLGFLQGIRRLRALAMCQVVSSPVAAGVTIASIYLFGTAGGAAALSLVSLTTLVVHVCFMREFKPRAPRLPIDYRTRVRDNLRTGSGFAVNGIWLCGSGWLNLYLLRHYYGDAGLHYIGMYGAASMLAGFYVGIIISALATEFYPSLTAAAEQPAEMRKLLNHQAVMALDIGTTAALFGMTFSPLMLTLLYSTQFTDASEILRLLFLGTAIRFAAFPLGFTMLALGKSKLFAMCELGMGALTLLSSVVAIHYFGLLGVGYAQIGANTVQVIFLLVTCHKLGVTWNRHTTTVGMVSAVFLVSTLFLILRSPEPRFWPLPLLISMCYLLLAANRIRKGSGISVRMIRDRLARKTRN